MAIPNMNSPSLDDHCHDKMLAKDRRIPQVWHQNRQTYQKNKSKIDAECLQRNCGIVAVQGDKLYFGRDVTSVLCAAGNCCFFMHVRGGPGLAVIPVQVSTLIN